MNDYPSLLSENRLAIFLLHGVVERSGYRIRNYTRKHLELGFFLNVMKDLKRRGVPLSMDEVIDCRRSKKGYPPYSFAITFDDGFENNFSIAAPVLKDLGIPATFYVTTDFVDRNTMSWIDRIEYCMERTEVSSLTLPWESVVHDIATPEAVCQLLTLIRTKVKSDGVIDADALVSHIYRQCRVPEVYQSDEPLDRKMSWKQIAALEADNLFRVGGHTHTHAVMSFLGADELEREIDTCLTLLLNKGGVSTVHFSYPEGLVHCFSNDVIAALKRHNIVCSPTAIQGVNGEMEDLFHLKRIAIT